jgi:hypothetical protein
MKMPPWTPAAFTAAVGLLLGSCATSPDENAASRPAPPAAAAPPAETAPAELAAVPDTLPVYDVVQDGATPAQARALAAALGLAEDKLALRNATLAYADPVGYLDIPTRPVTDPALLAQLKAASPEDAEDPDVTYNAIDFDAIRRRTVLDPEAALRAAATALAAAGLPLESAKPDVGHTVFEAADSDASGAPESVHAALDTRVTYRFATRDGIPFIGPGAQLAVTYDARGTVTQFSYAWRQVQEGETVRIIPPDEARRRIEKLLPPRSRIRMRLVYWCPPFDNVAGGKRLEPAAIIPWYAYTASTAPGPGVARLTRERLIPATDDRRFVPTVDRLDVSGSGTSLVGAGIGINGGRPPYTVVWTGSNPELQSNRTREASYVPLARAAGENVPPGETVPAMETISATAIDANGVSSFESLTFPVQARPIRAEDHRHKKHGQKPTYGCESPGEPEDWVQERVGWQAGMAQPGGGTQEFCWLGDNSWPGDYIKPSKPGTLPAKPWINGDADYANWGINTANLVLINGDGNQDSFTAMFPGAPQSDYNNDVGLNRPGNPGGTVQMPTQTYAVNYNGSWGTEGPNDRLYWLAGLLCYCLAPTDGGGLSTHQRWGPAFGGLHMNTGFSSEAAYSAGAFPKAFAENILGVSGSAQKIRNAWFNASTSTNEGTAAALGPITTGHVSDLDDYYVGQGSMGPSIAPSKITGWWYLHQ